MLRKDIRVILENKPYLKESLFVRGFLIINRKLNNLEDFPFYGNWRIEEHKGYYFLAHKLTGMYIYEEGDKCFFIMGHAYDPFTMEYKEEDILKALASSDDFIESVNDLTGVFVLGYIENKEIHYLVDPSGMQSACTGIINNDFCLSSHPQLIGDLYNLQMDSLVEELINYKWYGRILGTYLPADLTPFKELKRVIPNTIYGYSYNKISHRRFYPLKDIKTVNDDKEYQEVITSAADILKNGMELVSKKWNKPWISLTGGIDSNTTFAASKDVRDKFETFSYISTEKEIIDAEAAKKIANRFSVSHHEYTIPQNNDDIEDFEERRELFRHNNGYVAELYDNEARKKMYLHDNVDCDVEVKSWVSETVRAYWYKYYNRKSFPKLSAKLFRNLYKIFIMNRQLAHKIDILYKSYLKEYEYGTISSTYLPADINYWEIGWGSWGSKNISEMKYCFDITFVYNNRRFIDLLLRVPLDKRISDQHHLDMKYYLDEDLFDMNIRVKNLKETKLRSFLLNVIFTINCILPY